MGLETKYSFNWSERSVGEADPGSETIYSVVISHLEGSGRTVFTTRELQDEMRQPYSREQLRESLKLGEEVTLHEPDMDLWLYDGDQV